jgi:hypothetical protein
VYAIGCADRTCTQSGFNQMAALRAAARAAMGLLANRCAVGFWRSGCCAAGRYSAALGSAVRTGLVIPAQAGIQRR